MVDAEMTASPAVRPRGPFPPRLADHRLYANTAAVAPPSIRTSPGNANRSLTGEVATDLEAGFRCPLAPAHRSAPGLAINIFRCVGRGRGSPGRSEAERRGPPSSGQVQSQISGASGQPVASRGCLAERAAARRPPEGGTPEHRSRIFNLSLRRPSGGVRLVVLLHGQRDQIELDLDGEEARAPIVALSELRGVRRRAQHAEVA